MATLNREKMQIFSQNSILSKRLDKMKGVLKMYNVKISQYLESTEVVYYSNVITGREKEKDSFIVERDNELFEVYSFMAFGINKSEKSKEENALHSFFVSFNRTKNKIYSYARDNIWEWFLTFTFDPKLVDSFNYDEVVKCMSDFLRYMGDHSSCRTKYLIVPERHKSGRYHLHGVFSNMDMSLWKMKYSGHTTKGGLPIYNIAGFPYGFTTATQVQSSVRVSHYISKYITKDMFKGIKNKKRYWCTRNLDSGIHTTMMIAKSDLETLLNSFGEVQSMKTIDTPYNTIKFFQF